MKSHNYIIIFIVLLSIVFLRITYITDLTVAIDTKDENNRELLYEANEGALDAATKYANRARLRTLWTTETMKIAEQTLLDLFELRYDYSVNDESDNVSYLIPLIFYIDDNGYYITYQGTQNDGSAKNKRVTTPINTWSTQKDGYSIQYYLTSDQITIIDQEGKRTTGTCEYLWVALEHPSCLQTYFNSEDIFDQKAFNDDKLNFIILRLEERINYYVNNKDTKLFKTGQHYQYSLDISNDALSKMIERPGMLTFMQNEIVDNTIQLISMYGSSDFQLAPTIVYSITNEDGILLYHKKGCSHFSAYETFKTFQTKKLAAQYGANPCPDCLSW